MDDIERLWGVPETSAFLGVPEATFISGGTRRYGPRGRRVGRYVRYDPREVRARFAAQDEEYDPAGR